MIYLASRSPRRRALLEQIGVRHRVLRVEVEERRERDESPEAFVRRMARLKVETGRSRLAATDATPVLGADTAVVLDGEVLGKPGSADAARRMLERLSGRAHEVLTAVTLARVSRQPTAADEAIAVALSRSRVWFRELDPAECETYCASGEPLDKAGGYAIQGRAAVFVRHLEGSYSGVVGLPLFETAELLRAAGIPVPSRSDPAG